MVSAVGYVNSIAEEEKRFDKRALYITEIASQSGIVLLWDYEYGKLALFSQYILDDPLLSGVLFLSKSGGVNEANHAVGFTRSRGAIDENYTNAVDLYPEFYDDVNQVSLKVDDQEIGELFVFYDKRELYASQHKKIIRDLVSESLIFLLFFIAIYIVLQKQFVLPFKRSHELAKGLTESFNDFMRHRGDGGDMESCKLVDFNDLVQKHSIQLNRQDEVGDFYRAFNSLVKTINLILSELSQYSSQLSILNDELELRVSSRTEELEATCLDLQNTQSRMVQQEKMASIGQLAAGVAHEINNPLGYISSNINRLEEYVNDIFEYVDELEKMVATADTIEADTIEVGSVDVEKGSSHTIATLREKCDFDFIRTDLPELLKDCVEGSVRVQEIVENLKSFSRIDDAAKITEFDINDAVNNCLKLVHNELKYHCDVKKELKSTLNVLGHYGQINQVISNLLINASHAIKDTEKHGSITIKTWSDDSNVYLVIQDSGTGISEDYIDKIFDPFFTTKEVGKGTGLGLNISYDIIVNNHSGELTVESEIGKGTCFFITLPKSQQKDIGETEDGNKGLYDI